MKELGGTILAEFKMRQIHLMVWPSARSPTALTETLGTEKTRFADIVVKH